MGLVGRRWQPNHIVVGDVQNIGLNANKKGFQLGWWHVQYCDGSWMTRLRMVDDQMTLLPIPDQLNPISLEETDPTLNKIFRICPNWQMYLFWLKVSVINPLRGHGSDLEHSDASDTACYSVIRPVSYGCYSLSNDSVVRYDGIENLWYISSTV